jgi:signal transduction histidine kinase
MSARASDADREGVAALLREHHLAGRLDNADFEQRLAVALVARTHAQLAAVTADLPAEEPLRRARAWPSVSATIGAVFWRVVKRATVLVAVLVLAIWAVSSAVSHHGITHGSEAFWPAWVWFGMATPVAFVVAMWWAWDRPAGPVRRVVIACTLAAVVEAMLIVIWLLALILSGSSAGFWPAWTLLGLAAGAGLYTIVELRHFDPRQREALSARVDHLARSRRQTVDSQAAELGRIERDLHDGAQARLVALSMQLGRAELALEDQPGAQRMVAEAREEAARAIADLRDLSRGIAPPLLADRGLPTAVRALAERYDAVTAVDPALESVRLPQALERAAYFVVAEGLTNAAKHAGAGHVSVELTIAGSELIVAVTDDGRGGADHRGSGLTGLRDRVDSLGGSLVIVSPGGGGTTLEARFPTA